MCQNGTVIGSYMKGGRPVDALQFQDKNSRVAFTGSVASVRTMRTQAR